MKIGTWKLADDLPVALYEPTQTFPREEMHGLTSQLRRASLVVLALTCWTDNPPVS